MPPKLNREYKKGGPFRDYRKFVIVAEGEREDNYFKEFTDLSSRLKIVLVERDGGKSAVKFFQERLSQYDSKFGLIDTDLVWFVLDVDRWPRKEIEGLIVECQKQKKWNIAISNPCFETWLYYHYREVISEEHKNCKELKTAISKFNLEGYNSETFSKQIRVAIKNSKAVDINPKQTFPDKFVTKIYLLAEEMVKLIGSTIN